MAASDDNSLEHPEREHPALEHTALYALHLDRGGRMVDFAGYDLPVRYEPGPVAEHVHTRTAASLFDVSHMGVVELHGADAASELERLVPSAITTLAPGRLRYTFFTNHDAGVLDDLIVTNATTHLVAVVNASRKAADIAHLREGLGSGTEVRPRPDLALLALQGPEAVTALSRHVPAAGELVFMAAGSGEIAGIAVDISRSGYTGEDGFEITVAAEHATAVAEALLAEAEVELAGLAARDSLRLEAGLSLYGQDLDPTTTPVEAGLTWAIQKRRRTEGGYPGADIVSAQLASGPARVRVGIAADGRKPIREGARLLDSAGAEVGTVTSGGYGPSIEAPVAMGYVRADLADTGTALVADVRGREVTCTVADLPFTPHRYVR